MPTNYAFPNPFKHNHCVPLAWAHVAGIGAEGAIRLAEIATRERVLLPNGRVIHALNVYTGGVFGPVSWAEAARMRIKRLVKYTSLLNVKQRLGVVQWKRVTKRPTLAKFAKRHTRGKFVVFVPGHAVALIDGVLFGFYRPRSHVDAFIEVTGGGK